jgi:hypothetical protein
VLLKFAYLGVTNAFAILRLLPMTDRDKDTETLALHHQIATPERQLNGQRVRFTADDRTSLAALLQGLLKDVLRRMRLLMQLDTDLRRHCDLVPTGTPPGPDPIVEANRAPSAPSAPRSRAWPAKPQLGLPAPAR